MSEIVLPRLLGTREKAAEIVSSWSSAHSGDTEVEVAARAVTTATSSFVGAFVEALEEANVTKIALHGASNDFLGDIQEVAEKSGSLRVVAG